MNHVSSLLPDHNAHILVTIMAATAGVSKLVFGLVSDCLRNYRIFLQQGALLAHGVVLMLLPLCGEYSGFLAMAVSLGLSDAMIMVLYGPNVVDLVGAERASQAFGFMSLLSIPGFLSAPAITGQYWSVQCGGGVVLVIVCVCMYMLRFWCSRETHEARARARACLGVYAYARARLHARVHTRARARTHTHTHTHRCLGHYV